MFSRATSLAPPMARTLCGSSKMMISPAFAGNHAALRSRDAVTAGKIVESGFLILIRPASERGVPKAADTLAM